MALFNKQWKNPLFSNFRNTVFHQELSFHTFKQKYEWKTNTHKDKETYKIDRQRGRLSQKIQLEEGYQIDNILVFWMLKFKVRWFSFFS